MEIINAGNRIINNYIIKLNKGYLLIDTGYHEQFKGFCKRLKKNNIKLEHISYIFLTHAHDDHAGFLNELLDNSNAKIILHPHAVSRLKKGQNCLAGYCTSYLALFGSEIIKLFGKTDHRFPPVEREERYIVLDETTKPMIEKVLPGRIIYLAGHTPDSIGLLCEDGSLFCGDAAMNGIPSKNRITIWVESLEDYLKSWEIMLSLRPAKIFPSHGNPFIKEDLENNIKFLKNTKLYSLK